MRFYFAVKHGGVWKVAEGLYDEKARSVMLGRAERDVLSAIKGAVVKALEKLDNRAKAEEPKERVDKKGNVEACCLRLYGPHLVPFLKHAADSIKAELAEVQLEGAHVVKASGVKAEFEFRLLKGEETKFLLAQDVEQALALYKSLRALGVPVEIAPKGVKVDSEALCALVAAAFEKTIEHASCPTR